MKPMTLSLMRMRISRKIWLTLMRIWSSTRRLIVQRKWWSQLIFSSLMLWRVAQRYFADDILPCYFIKDHLVGDLTANILGIPHWDSLYWKIFGVIYYESDYQRFYPQTFTWEIHINTRRFISVGVYKLHPLGGETWPVSRIMFFKSQRSRGFINPLTSLTMIQILFPQSWIPLFTDNTRWNP